MKTGTLFRHLLSASSLILLSCAGCMKLGPDYHRPEPGFAVPAAYRQADAYEHGGIRDDRWWMVFGDPTLNHLVEEVLRNNLDIRKATAVLLQVASRFDAATAERFPRLDLQAGIQRQRQTTQVTVPVLQGTSFQMKTVDKRITIDTRSLSLPASFEVDLWGRLARAEEAARADLLQALENRRTIAQGIVAETVNLYLNMEALERRIGIARQSIELYRHSLSLVEGRYRRGLASILDVRQARRVLARAQASLPALRQELGIVQQNLALLLGRYPETAPARRQPADYYRLPDPVPPGLPSDLLERRPDIRAAEARLRALNARVGVAKASRFPRITLTASFGYASDELDRLFKPESELWSIAAGLVQPIFDAGRLKAAQRGAEAAYRAGVVDYAKTVLKAFGEVERALLTRKMQLERREEIMERLKEARATQEVAELRYKRGLVGYLSVLDAQQARYEAEENLVLVELSLLTNRVSLHRALGGGWGEPTNGPGDIGKDPKP